MDQHHGKIALHCVEVHEVHLVTRDLLHSAERATRANLDNVADLKFRHDLCDYG